MKPLHVGILVVIIVLFGIAALTILLALDKTVGPLLGLLTALAAPTITSLLALVKVDTLSDQVAENAAKADQVAGQLAEYRNEINGKGH